MSLLNKFKIKRKLIGAVEGISRGFVFGWAVSKTAIDQDIRLRIVVDGIAIGTTECSIVRADITHAASAGYRCGFRFDLKPYLRNMAGHKLEIQDEATGAAITPSPIELASNSGWGVLDGIYGTEVKGWAVCAKPRLAPTIVELLIDGEIAGCAVADQARPDLKKAGVPHLNSGFSFFIPTRWHDGKIHTVSARVKGCVSNLRGGEVKFACQVRAHIDVFSPGHVSGWIINMVKPTAKVVFDVWVNGELIKKSAIPDHPRYDLKSLFTGNEEVSYMAGFHITIPSKIKWSNNLNHVDLCLPGTRESLLNKDYVAFNRFDLLEFVEKISAQLATATDGEITKNASTAASRFFYLNMMPEIISKMRMGSFDQQLLVHSNNRKGLAADKLVDVIIPVYKGYHETLDCIRSVLATRNECPMEIVVINDRSPDAKLSADLKKLAAKEHFTLIENETNLGFVATVNKGMKLHYERDVLLLNSDTVVPRGWLVALRRAAYAAPNIGTVTPFSNRATIFSLPRTCFDNDMPLGMSVEQISTLCAERNPGVIVDVPTAVGFCMYIRRDTLNNVGAFDEERWAKGYGEENDFCLRATSNGWRNVAACDVFVQHHGSVSFNTEKAPRVTENLAKLHTIYPDYPERINRFLISDPMAAPRCRINVTLFKKLSPCYILFVTHNLGGGTETAIRKLCKIHAADGKNVLILRSDPSGKLLLAPALAPHEKTLISEYPHHTQANLLAEHLRELNVEYVHFHHTLGFKLDIWRLPELLGVPYDVMIHDFYMACPRINLIDESGFYCGQPDTAACERCVKSMPLQHDAEFRLAEIGGTVAQWRQFHMAQLKGARKVVTPSQNARTHIQKYLPIQHIEATPHPEQDFTYTPREWDGHLPYKVALLGAIGQHKGADLLLACAKYALRENLPVQFVVIGYTNQDEAFADLENVEITGPYEPENLRSLVQDSGCQTALFLSLWPETYSYTLSEAWRLGLYPVALDIGAQAQRIRESKLGDLIPFTNKPSEIMKRLMNTLYLQQTNHISSVLHTQVTAAEPNEY